MKLRLGVALFSMTSFLIVFALFPHTPVLAQATCTDSTGGSIPCPPSDDSGPRKTNTPRPIFFTPTHTPTETSTETPTNTATETSSPTFTFTPTEIPSTSTVRPPTNTPLPPEPPDYRHGIGIGVGMLLIVLVIFLPILRWARNTGRNG